MGLPIIRQEIHVDQIQRQEVPGDLLPYTSPTVAGETSYVEAKSPHIVYTASGMLDSAFSEKVESLCYDINDEAPLVLKTESEMKRKF